jgi:hypothetical protein
MRKIKNQFGSQKGLFWIFGGWAGTTIGFYPGFMSQDSFNQYFQALTGNFNDHHPVIMAVLWGELLKVLSGPVLMLLLQTTLYWMAFAILYLKSNKYAKRNWILYLAFAPFLLSLLGVIWKDIQFATGILLIFATSLNRPKFRNKLSHYLILLSETLLLVYVANVRANSWAVIPFIVYLWVRSYKPSPGKFRTATLALVISLAFFLFGQFFTTSIVHAKQTNITNDYVVDGLFYFSVKEKTSLIPGVKYEDIVICSQADIAGMKLNGRFFCLNMTGRYDTSLMNPKVLNKTLIEKISADPISFAKFKVSAFSEFQGTFWEKNYYYWHVGIEKNDLGISHKNNFFTLGIKNISDLTATVFPFAFAPIFWLWASIIMVSLSWRKRKVEFGHVSLILALSGFLYNFQNILAAGGPDFRYFYWSAIATCISFITLSFSQSKSLVYQVKTAPITWKIFWFILTVMCIFQVQIFHHVNYLDLLQE